MKTNLLYFCTLLALAGCGGSSSDSSTASSVSISGVAAKGALIGADVQAYQVINGSLVALGSPVKTDGDGSYSLTGVSATTNPVVIQVTVNSTTTMRDETGTPGGDGKFPLATNPPKAGTVMRTAVQSLSASTEAPITPFTEMAVAAAVSTGQISASSLAVGQDQMEQLVGFNPFTVKPIVNANDSNSSSQKTMMAYLASVQNSAKIKGPTCSGDPSGVSCVLADLNNKVKGSLDSTGKFIPSNPTGLQSAIQDGFTGLDLSNGPMASMNLSTLKTAVAAPTQSDPTASLQKASLDSFINVMRTGFNSANTLINDRVLAAKGRLDTLSANTANDGFSAVGKLLKNCQVNSTVTNIVCTGDSFTKSGSSYNFSYVEGIYTYTGTVSASDNSGNVSILLSATKIITSSSQKLSEFNLSIIGQGLVDASTSASIKIDKLTAKAYDSVTPTQYATIDLSGLTVTGTKADNKLIISAPIVISDYAGDSFAGNFSATGYDLTATSGYKVLTQVGLSLTVKAANSSVIGLTIDVNQAKTFNQNQTKSSSNNPQAVVSITATFADNVAVKITGDETTWGKNIIGARVTSNGNWLQLDATESLGSNGKYVLPDAGVVKLTSSGTYSATLTKTNGSTTGDLLSGTTKIGTFSNNILTVNGREVSIR